MVAIPITRRSSLQHSQLEGDFFNCLPSFLWVALSGIGGFGLQNWDFNFRNAVLHDLVDYSWPVVYPQGRILLYYFTYWLPAALAGKIFGWFGANIFLFVWIRQAA
jgi:hypothetical protein